RVEGDSMMPTLAHGDEIMVDTADGAARLRDGIYVIRIDDELKVKRLARAPGRGRVSVVSDNPAYPRFDDVALSDIGVVGRVVWTGRRLG
ncbi:MAG: S24 family peptidase, partial [Sphingomonadales bacterium]|nr:S24 family peptidase [Sphingomonadales bacterium]